MAPAVPKAIGGRPMPPHPSPHLSPINQGSAGVNKGVTNRPPEANWRKSAGRGRRYAATTRGELHGTEQSQGYWFESNRGSSTTTLTSEDIRLAAVGADLSEVSCIVYSSQTDEGD